MTPISLKGLTARVETSKVGVPPDEKTNPRKLGDVKLQGPMDTVLQGSQLPNGDRLAYASGTSKGTWRMIGMRKARKLLVLIATVASISLMAETAFADVGYSEDNFAQLINADRAANGLPTLAVETFLVTPARAQSARMASAGEIFHNPNLAAEFASGWQSLGENVGVGGTIDDLHAAFMNSPSHRANVLGNYDKVGIGIVMDGSTIYVTELFWKTASTTPTIKQTRTCRKVRGRTVCKRVRRRSRR